MTSKNHQKRMIYFFGDGRADGGNEVRPLVGGKGASLAEMTRAGLNVPPGFTISTDCCDRYLRAGKKWPEGLEDEVRGNLTRLEKVVGRPFGQGDNPLLVSVRSGAAESMPGMMDTVLNVGLTPASIKAMAQHTANPRPAWDAYRHFLVLYGHVVAGIDETVFANLLAEMLKEWKKPSEDDLDGAQVEMLCERLLLAYRQHAGHDMPTDPWEMLRQAINAVFNSWNNERAVAFRQHHHFHNLPGTAVTVQVMCPSEVSGVMFTANPMQPTLNQVIIESSYGLGEAVVLGKVHPDRFVLDKKTLTVLRRDVSVKDQVIAAVDAAGNAPSRAKDRASLTDPQLVALARLGLHVEAHFQMPCDVEWGLAEGKFYLLQARAIKGLEDPRLIEQVRHETIDKLHQLADGRRCGWVIYNLAETLPSPTPMTWDVMRRFMSGSGGYGLMYQDFGFRPSERVKHEGFLDLICGRIYLNTQRHAEFYWGDFPWDYDLDRVKLDPAQAEAMPTRMDSHRAKFSLFLKLPGLWRQMRHSNQLIAQLQKDYDKHFHDKVLPPYLAFIKEQQAEDLTRLDAEELVRRFEAYFQRVMNDFAKEAIKLSYFGSTAQGQLHAQLKKLLGDDEGQVLAQVLTAGLEHDKTVEANIKLTDVARGRLTRGEYLAEFGHRANQEFELSQPRWRENPAFLDTMVETFRANPDANPAQLHEKMKLRREEAERSLPETLQKHRQAKAAGALAELCDLVRRYLPYRETAKHYWLMGYELLRRVLLEIDRRKHLDGGVFFLHARELPDLMAGEDFTKEITERRERRRTELRVSVPDVVTTDDLEAIGRPIKASWGGSSLQGVGVAPGSGTGPAVVLFDPTEGGGLTPGYVLVCPSTDPGWTPLFINAAGLILERGGMLSHGAVVARDLGIPALVLKGATESITPGEVIRVDGDTGLAHRQKAEISVP